MTAGEQVDRVGDLTLRFFQPGDRDQLLALNTYGLAAAGIAISDDYYVGEDFSDLEGTYAEAAGGVMIVGEVERKVVAMGGIRRLDDMTCELLRMRVYPEYQGRGYGTAILELLEQEAQRLGYAWIQLLTGEEQHPAVDLYTRHGYQVTRREMLIGIPSVHMSKQLSMPTEAEYRGERRRTLRQCHVEMGSAHQPYPDRLRGFRPPAAR